MSGLRFIEANPYDRAFDNRVRQREDSRRARLAQETGQFRLDEAQQAAQRQRQRDRVLSETVGTEPRGSTLRDTAASRLARAGQGRAAFEQGVKAEDTRATQAKAARDRSDQQFDTMINELGSGRPESALAIAQRAGMKITPSVQAAFNNSYFQRELKARFDRNKQAFKDPRQFEKQMQRDVVELLGAVAANRGGVPQRTAGAPRLEPTQGAAQKYRGQPFPSGPDRKLFIMSDQGAVPVRSGDEQLTGAPPRAARDPFVVTPSQRLNLINKRAEVIASNNFFSANPLSDEQILEQATRDVDAQLVQGGARNPTLVAGLRDVQAAPDVAPAPAGPETAPASVPDVSPPTAFEAQRFFLEPLPMLSDGTPDVDRLVVGKTYNTARGPARYTGIPGREFQAVR